MKKVNLKKLTVSVITATAMALTVMAPTVFNSANIVNSRSITANAANIVMSEAEYQRGLHIYQYLKNHTSWNDGAICGILAHLYTESRFNPCVINKTSYAYGVAQWLGVRKNNLMKHANYSNIDVQLNFMINEINTDKYFIFTKNAINTAENNANGAYNTVITLRANFGWGTYGSSPKAGSQYTDCLERAKEAKDFFYPKYAKAYATLPGDLDLNGQVDLTDCTYLSMYLLGDTTFEKIAGNAAATKANADVNCDGEVDIADVSALKVLVTTPSNNTSTTVSYAVSLTAGTPIYAEPGSSTINQTLSASGTFTITKEKTVNGVKYGYLKSGAGWVKLSNTNANTGEISVNYAKYLAKGTVILKDAGSSTINQTLSASGTFTITKEKTVNGVKYGYLKSGAGWVKL